jgi:acetyl esterase/lipase
MGPMSADLHPDLRRIGRFLPTQMVSPTTLPLMRLSSTFLGRRTPRNVEVAALGPGASVRLFRPAASTTPAPALLWIHGGGYVIGTAAQDDKLCARFADALGTVVASVDYRLAPEHPYPAALNDCYSALTLLAELPMIDRSRIAIGGASAGGGLAAALALMVRDRNEIPVAAQLLVYPMLDDRTVEPPQAGRPRVRMWNHRSNRFGWASYLGAADAAVAVPARREDLAGLPPAWIGVGDVDLFHDEDVAYAARLKAAGVRCELEVVPGAFHGFDLVMPRTSVARAFFDSQCATLQRAFTRA